MLNLSKRNKNHYNKGKNNPNYVDGHTIYQHYCINCNKYITYNAKRCKSCAYKLRKLTLKQKEKLRNFRLGKKASKKTIKKLKLNAKNNSDYGMKNKNHTTKSRIKMSLSKGGKGILNIKHLYNYEFIKNRKYILKRDNYKCQLCGKKTNDVHHIDYDKQNGNINNLISLCERCNIKVNFNRGKWEKYFKNVISRIS